MALLVQKFGGTAVADGDRIRAVADHVARTRRRGHDVVVVISAMGKETDELIQLARGVSGAPPGRELDMLITTGERKAAALLCMALHEQGVDASSFTGSQAGFLTDTTHTNAKILAVNAHRLREVLDEGYVPVVGGAQGVSTDRDITFLGRGGSDTSAVALAHSLGADSCELYTDVSGIFTADPRVVPDARKIPRLPFESVLEMTATGCPKPAMRSVEFARTHGVPLQVRSAFTWEPGTWITEEEDSMEDAIVSAVTHDTSEAKITVVGVSDQPGIAGRLFRVLADEDINVDTTIQNVSAAGHTDISFSVPRDDLAKAFEVCQVVAEELGAREITSDDHMAKVSVVGAGMKTNPGVAAKMFETLADNDINIGMISTSAIRISCTVDEDERSSSAGGTRLARGVRPGRRRVSPRRGAERRQGPNPLGRCGTDR
ncbi:MAG: aspartate kinase [Acidimicrobiia bacterium]|nr:aspartate kinase [Acidimicrobiia bacterium]